MTPNLLDELEGVVRLSERATPGTWHQDTGGDITRDDGTTLFTREKPDGRSSISFANADYVEAAVNFLRTHAPALADMAKRMEAAERDAARYAFLRDKQATIIYKRKGHGVWEPLIDTRETSTRCASLDEAVDAAIDATQEGEG